MFPRLSTYELPSYLALLIKQASEGNRINYNSFHMCNQTSIFVWDVFSLNKFLSRELVATVVQDKVLQCVF